MTRTRVARRLARRLVAEARGSLAGYMLATAAAGYAVTELLTLTRPLGVLAAQIAYGGHP